MPPGSSPGSSCHRCARVRGGSALPKTYVLSPLPAVVVTGRGPSCDEIDAHAAVRRSSPTSLMMMPSGRGRSSTGSCPDTSTSPCRGHPESARPRSLLERRADRPRSLGERARGLLARSTRSTSPGLCVSADHFLRRMTNTMYKATATATNAPMLIPTIPPSGLDEAERPVCLAKTNGSAMEVVDGVVCGVSVTVGAVEVGGPVDRVVLGVAAGGGPTRRWTRGAYTLFAKAVAVPCATSWSS